MLRVSGVNFNQNVQKQTNFSKGMKPNNQNISFGATILDGWWNLVPKGISNKSFIDAFSDSNIKYRVRLIKSKSGEELYACAFPAKEDGNSLIRVSTDYHKAWNLEIDDHKDNFGETTFKWDKTKTGLQLMNDFVDAIRAAANKIKSK